MVKIGSEHGSQAPLFIEPEDLFGKGMFLFYPHLLQGCPGNDGGRSNFEEALVHQRLGEILFKARQLMFLWMVHHLADRLAVLRLPSCHQASELSLSFLHAAWSVVRIQRDPQFLEPLYLGWRPIHRQMLPSMHINVKEWRSARELNPAAMAVEAWWSRTDTPLAFSASPGVSPRA